MDEYWDDVLNFANNYSNIKGYKDVIKELKKVNSTGSPNFAMEGASFMIDKIRRTPEITPSSVRKFDGKFEGEIEHICDNCRFDIELNDGTKYEYKSYSEASINRISTSDPFLKQHLRYLSETSDINMLRYEFDASKFSDRQKIVEQFQKMYQKDASRIFKTMKSELRETLLGKGNANRFDLFEQAIVNTNSDLYKFIKIE